MAKVNNIGGLYRFLEWLMWIFYINILWIVFMCIGLIVFGIFPATAAMFAVYRDWFRKDVVDMKITKTFLEVYKKDFLKANMIGYIVVVIGFILYLDFQLLANVEGVMWYVMQIGLIFFGLIYIIMILHIFPVYVHYNLKFTDYFKHAIVLGISNPLTTIAMVIGLILFYFLFRYIPGLIPTIGISTPAAVIMACALIAFNNIDAKQRRYNNEDK